MKWNKDTGLNGGFHIFPLKYKHFWVNKFGIISKESYQHGQVRWLACCSLMLNLENDYCPRSGTIVLKFNVIRLTDNQLKFFFSLGLGPPGIGLQVSVEIAGEKCPLCGIMAPTVPERINLSAERTNNT